MKKEFNLGAELKDVVTGFTGLAIARVAYITGCDQYHIQPKAKDGSVPDALWIDVIRLEKISDGVSLDLSKENELGAGNPPLNNMKKI